jgi:hypothetical protein
MARKKTAKKSPKRKPAKKTTKKKVAKTASRPRSTRTPRSGGPGKISKVSAKDVNPVYTGTARGSQYDALFEQMQGLDPSKPDVVLKAYPPDGVDARTYQSRVNSTMLARKFQRPKGYTYYKRVCVDEHGFQYLAISITPERNYA